MIKTHAVRIFAKMAESPSVAQHGQVMTKPHVVGLILDLCGYCADKRLLMKRLLEPGCGDGEFLVEAARRLLASLPKQFDPDVLLPCLLGIEKDAALADQARRRLADTLAESGISSRAATRIAKSWVRTGDFLRLDVGGDFDFVVGNPPYVRQEGIDKDELAFYRESLSHFYDRADLYLAFLEKGLSLLGSEGMLGFICPNRFTRNRYGTKLRSHITKDFKLHQAIDLSQASPFEPEVLAYPGIYIIGRGRTSAVDFFHMKHATPAECSEVIATLRGGDSPEQNGVRYHRYEEWFSGEEPWITESPDHLDFVRRLEAQYPTLGSPASGTKVGIGVATGADQVFIVPSDFDEVESSLLLPLAMTRDCTTGVLRWGGNCVINPFASEKSSQLINLDDFPLAKAYFGKFQDRLRKRNVGKRNPINWFRTIDRIYPSLRKRPKLLVPDIKADSGIVYDKGRYYPHHNLYYVVSDYWDLLAPNHP